MRVVTVMYEDDAIAKVREWVLPFILSTHSVSREMGSPSWRRYMQSIPICRSS